MILRAACQDCMWDEEGHFIKRPHWFELAKQRWCQIYKTTGTPCSCWMCKGETYSRKDSKKEAQNIIKESLEYFFGSLLKTSYFCNQLKLKP